jgi:predicted acyl esterase
VSTSVDSGHQRIVSGTAESRRAGAGRTPRHSWRIRALATLAPLAVCVCLTTAASASAFSASGSVEQVYATGLRPNVPVELRKGANKLQTLTADSLGGVLFRNLTPAKGYRVLQRTAKGRLKRSGKLTVHNANAAPWDPAVYNQPIPEEGYGYLTTRDGTKLAYSVHPPTKPAGQKAGSPNGIKLPNFPANGSFTPPYPTLIEYSGYGYANPEGPESGIAVLANLMGFAVVDVNMRGTGCSSGAFDFFEPLQNLDGYDVIETIAKQPWVLDNKVGMLGISYGGISQLFTAQLRPASLEAITPLSVIDATATTLYPGGVLNDGFAVAWSEQRQQNAEPAIGPGHGQEWANERIAAGDTTCAANQALHGEAADLSKKIKENSHYNAAVADPLDPVTFVHNITVPTFMACQFEDEQTGGHCQDLAQHFTGTRKKWFNFTNGAHIDSLDPYTYDRWYDFLELFVAHKNPAENSAAVKAAAPIVYQEALGLPDPCRFNNQSAPCPSDTVVLPPDPIQEKPTYESALAEFEALPSIRVLFDNGAGKAPSGGTEAAGNPYPGYIKEFTEWPVPGTTAKTWYFGAGGTLNEAPPASAGEDTYTSDANATPKNDYAGDTGGGGLWGNASEWTWNFVHPPTGDSVSYTTPALASDTTALGAGAVEVWAKSSTPDVDFLATVSEVRPDGKEVFVQNGWMRASERKLATNENNLFKQMPTQVQPIPTELASDVQPMPSNEFVPVVIPLYFEGHPYRAGSSIKVTLQAPNGTQPIWSFSHTQPEGTTASVSIAFAPNMPSSLTLATVPGLSVPTALPGCPSFGPAGHEVPEGTLRNEPCHG